ncbi:MAG: tetratricopeptide repeat protein [Alphaproteobacteria bacterium]|nr:tetratricopeptide repeat protein [Alphaproteobacteria bacterium]
MPLSRIEDAFISSFGLSFEDVGLPDSWDPWMKESLSDEVESVVRGYSRRLTHDELKDLRDLLQEQRANRQGPLVDLCESCSNLSWRHREADWHAFQTILGAIAEQIDVHLSNTASSVETTPSGGLYGHLAPAGPLSHDEARALAAQVQARDEADAAFNSASAEMLQQRYPEAIEALTQVAERYPRKRASCLLNIGACHFFLGAYSSAIHTYQAAGAAGAPAHMVADNIREAEEAMAAR